TDNADLKLLPYLTASVKFIVARHDDVLAVPNAALRWSPRDVAPPAAAAGAPGGPNASKTGAEAKPDAKAESTTDSSSDAKPDSKPDAKPEGSLRTRGSGRPDNASRGS